MCLCTISRLRFLRHKNSLSKYWNWIIQQDKIGTIGQLQHILEEITERSAISCWVSATFCCMIIHYLGMCRKKRWELPPKLVKKECSLSRLLFRMLVISISHKFCKIWLNGQIWVLSNNHLKVVLTRIFTILIDQWKVKTSKCRDI